jgi:flagellar hook-associated protein FlgK
MPSFSGISVALQSLLTQQQAIDVINHNVANANTPGYHRQEVVLNAGPTQAPPGFLNSTIMSQIGTGVMLSSIKRYNDNFTDTRFRSETAESSRWTLENNILNQVQSAEAETSTDGLSQKLDAFWAGWKAVSTDPEDTALRANLLETGKAVAQAFNTRFNTLTQIQQDSDNSIVQNVQEINTLGAQIAQLNTQIGRYQKSSTQPNDFLDQQANYLDRLSQLTGAKITFENNGQAMVSIGGHMLVQGSTVLPLTTTIDTSNNNFRKVQWADGQPFNPTSGEMVGIFDVRDNVIANEKTNLNNLAATVFNSVNQVHEKGYGLDDGIPSLTTTGSGVIHPGSVNLVYNSGSLLANGVNIAPISGSPNDYLMNGIDISVDNSGGTPVFSVNGNNISTSGSATLTMIGTEPTFYDSVGGSLYDHNGTPISPVSGSPNNYTVNGIDISVDNTSGTPVFSEYGLYPSYPYSSGSPNNPVGRDFFVVKGDSGYSSGWDSSGSPTNKIYTPPSMINLAQTISINGSLGVRDVAAAQDPTVSGDGRNAEALFLLQTSRTNLMQVNSSYSPGPPVTGGTALTNITSGGNPVLDNIDKYNSQRVTELSLIIQKSDTMATQHKNLLDVLTKDRESVGGVSLDEEAANLMAYQRSYQASIRMMTAVDDMLNRVINNMGKAGM